MKDERYFVRYIWLATCRREQRGSGDGKGGACRDWFVQGLDTMCLNRCVFNVDLVVILWRDGCVVGLRVEYRNREEVGFELYGLRLADQRKILSALLGDVLGGVCGVVWLY